LSDFVDAPILGNHINGVFPDFEIPAVMKNRAEGGIVSAGLKGQRNYKAARDFSENPHVGIPL
jgi:hypothetical protein